MQIVKFDINNLVNYYITQFKGGNIMVNISKNIILTDLNKDELLNVFIKINQMPLVFRKKLNLSPDISFGNEIEFNDLILKDAKVLVNDFNTKNGLDNKDSYKLHVEKTAEGEIVTPIHTDTEKDWELFRGIYDALKNTGATIAGNTASHIHIGTHMIDTPEKLSLLLKTLVVFEPIIFKFGYGYDEEPREYLRAVPNRCAFSIMMTPKRVKNFIEALDKYNYNSPGEMNKCFKDFLAMELAYRPVFNFNGFDFNKLQYRLGTDEPSEYDHMEVRCFNGTLNEEIAQNNINLISHIFMAVIEGKLDIKYINEEYAKYAKKKYSFNSKYALFEEEKEIPQYNRLLDGFNKIKMEKALKLADMIFDNELDKYYFLKQYLKLFYKDEEYIVSLVK